MVLPVGGPLRAWGPATTAWASASPKFWRTSRGERAEPVRSLGSTVRLFSTPAGEITVLHSAGPDPSQFVGARSGFNGVENRFKFVFIVDCTDLGHEGKRGAPNLILKATWIPWLRPSRRPSFRPIRSGFVIKGMCFSSSNWLPLYYIYRTSGNCRYTSARQISGPLKLAHRCERAPTAPRRFSARL